jgi:hypothetical protein
MDLTANSIKFVILADIVDTIIGDIFFRNDEQLLNDSNNDNDITATEVIAKRVAKKSKEKANTMKLFVKQSDELMYKVTTKNVTHFELAMDHVSIGMSFQQTTAVIQQAKDHTKTTKLVGINDLIVSQYVRAVVTTILQDISDIIDDESIWAISLTCDNNMHRGQSFFDLRLLAYYCNDLTNLHLVVVPMFERQTAENMFNMVVKFLDTLYGRWRNKLIRVSSDGKNMMTGHHSGFVMRRVRSAFNKVLCVWCMPH